MFELVGSCWLLVVGCLLLVAGGWWLVVAPGDRFLSAVFPLFPMTASHDQHPKSRDTLSYRY